MIGKYEIEFVDGSTREYEGDLINNAASVCIGSACLPKKNIKHILMRELVED